MNARCWKCLALMIAALMIVIGLYLYLDWFRWQGHAESSTDVVLELVCEQPVIKLTPTPYKTVFAAPQIDLFVVNRGDTSVMLVEPGDGSTEGWRTPTIIWSHQLADFGRCGNTNPLKRGELFILQPGESRRLSTYVHGPRFDKPGRYQVSARFVNDPDQEWRGLPLGEHNAWAMRQVRRSTRVSAVSNIVEIVVQE